MRRSTNIYAVMFAVVFSLAGCNGSSFSGGSDILSGITGKGKGKKGGGGGDGAQDGKGKKGGGPGGSDSSGNKDGSSGRSSGSDDNGIPGGHFDLDTSIATYPFNNGKTEHHIHEYDNKFNVPGVDFFNMLDEQFVDIKEGIQSPSRRFIIIIANTHLSGGGTLIINGQAYSTQDWEQKVKNHNLPVFVLGAPSQSDEVQLTEFKINFDISKSIEGQLVPTITGLVVPNAPGPNGEYRAGALTLQSLDADSHTIDPILGTAAIGAAGMIWEATLFWHKE